MKIIFCHHAERDMGNPPTQNDKLTKLGVKDAKLNAKIFEEINENGKIKAIYASPYFRCMETARIINKKINAPIMAESRFNEFKSVENETWTDFLKRNIDAINDIAEKYNNDDAIICVTSGVNIGAFICWNFGLTPSEKTPFLGVVSCSPIMFNYNKK